MRPTDFQPPPLSELLTSSLQGERFAQSLRAAHKELPERIAQLDCLDPRVAREVLGIALLSACTSSHIASINLGRAAVFAVPRPWAVANVVDVARETLDLSDEWELRRFLELLCGLDTEALRRFASDILSGGKVELREAAEDLLRIARPD